MSLGTGIFLSTLILSLVALYITTKDRWRWKRILMWGGGALIAVPSLILIATFVTDEIKSWPKPLNSYWGITIGSKEDEVLLLKGEPEEKNGDRWIYSDDYESDLKYAVVFKKGAAVVRYVAVIGHTSGEMVNGISLGDDYASVIERLGKPDNISVSKDGLSRLLSFKKYRTAVGLERGLVEFLAVYDGEKPLRMTQERAAK